jgi:hypothetical protein
VKTKKQYFKGGGLAIVLLVLITFLLQSCGGAGIDGLVAGGGTIGTGITVWGIMTKGSIKVGDKTFDASGATLREDDNPATETDLQDGMKVKLKGELSADGVNGVAFVVEAIDEVQGRVTSLDVTANPPSFEVLQQTIFTDDLTLFSDFPAPNPDDINDMADDQFVEVHGLRDANGDIRATRVELLADVGDADPEESELKGVVSGLSGFTFFLGLQEVDFLGAIIEPGGATINDGDFVEVEGDLDINDVLVASKVEREDLEDQEFEPDEGDEAEFEGFVSDFTSHPGDFKVDGRSVRTSSSTEFENGSDQDLRNGIKVDAEGQMSGGILIVEEIEFKRSRVRVNAEATAVGPTDVTLAVTTLEEITVQINDLTEIDPGILPLTTTTFYEIEGFQASNGNIIAEKIETGDSGRSILQAKVISKDDATDTATLLEAPESTVIDLSTVTEFEDDDENLIADVDTFLGLVTPGKTVIKVRDDDLDDDWDNAELED